MKTRTKNKTLPNWNKLFQYSKNEREERKKERTATKEEELTVSNEISSTLGLNKEIWELELESESLESHGDNWMLLLLL